MPWNSPAALSKSHPLSSAELFRNFQVSKDVVEFLIELGQVMISTVNQTHL